MNNSKIVVTKLEDVKNTSDGRKYRQVYFEPHGEAANDELDTIAERSRVFFDRGYQEPEGSVKGGDRLFHSIQKALDAGNKVEGMKAKGEIITDAIVPEFIKNEMGKSIDPETGAKGNIITSATVIRIGNETKSQAFRRQGHMLLSEKEMLDQQTQQAKQAQVDDGDRPNILDKEEVDTQEAEAAP